MQSVLYDAAGHRRSPVTMPGYHRGRPPRNKGLRYPADPPAVEEIIAVMRAAGDRPDGTRLRGLIVLLWRAGLRIHEALELAETDLDAARGAVIVRKGKGGRRREVGMDRWAWSQLEAWRAIRSQLPVGAFLCVIHGPTAGRRWDPSAARKLLRVTAAAARRASPLRAASLPMQGAAGSMTQLPYHPHIQHANLGITSIYLQGIDSSEIIEAVHARPAPVISASAGLKPNP